jgi:hypothetical protein
MGCTFLLSQGFTKNRFVVGEDDTDCWLSKLLRSYLALCGLIVMLRLNETPGQNKTTKVKKNRGHSVTFDNTFTLNQKWTLNPGPGGRVMYRLRNQNSLSR